MLHPSHWNGREGRGFDERRSASLGWTGVVGARKRFEAVVVLVDHGGSEVREVSE